PGDSGPRSLTSDSKGNVYLPDQEGRRILRVDPRGKVTPFADVPYPPPAPNPAPVVGLLGLGPVLHMGPGDRLYAFTPGTALTNIATVSNAGSIVSWSVANGSASDEKVHATADKFQIEDGVADGVTDFAVTQNGTIYALLNTSIKRIDPSGQVSAALDWSGLNGPQAPPAGITLSPDQSMAVTVDQFTGYGWSFQIAADGSLVNGEPFYRLEISDLPSTPEWEFLKGSPAEDTNGMVYFPTLIGIQVAMQNGRIVEILNPPIPGGGPLTA